MHHFYSEEITDNAILLSEEESRHCTKVMRLNAGDEVLVFDGKGGQYHASIVEAGKQVRLDILHVKHVPADANIQITLAVSPTKSADRMEWMLEKLVEIGIFRLVFIKTEKGERSRLNTKRLYKKAVSAMKQSGNLWLPQIETEVKIKDFIQTDDSEKRFIAHCFDSTKSQVDESIKAKSVTVLIGPEGDFSLSELKLATENGYQPLSLGLPRYRTETAAVVSCTLINHFCVTLAS